MIRVITIEREYGSGGAAIAQKLARLLGWKLWDRALTNEIARIVPMSVEGAAASRVQADPLFYRLAKVFMRGSFERGLPVSGIELLEADRLVVLIQGILERAASAGNAVIVGRGSPYLLRHRPDVFSVFIFAPIEEKIRRVMAAGKTEAEAIELISTIDRERATFVKKYYGAEWPSRHLYHMMLNSKLGDEIVVQMILGAVTAIAREGSEPPAPCGE